jgi:DNA-binding CsgD family transcriptional regulator
MLLGREGERAQLEDLLSGARAGISSALVIAGAAGVGKSALLHFAREQAVGEGFTTVFAQGVESESDIAFSALSALLRPLLGQLDGLPAPQTAALASALAVGPPVAGDRFTVSAATLSLLAAAAEEKPLLVLVDDGQWIDRASAEALLFAARRLVAEGILILFTQREDVGELDTTGLPVLRLGGLDAKAARELLQERIGGQVAPDVAERLVAATGGNALALAELPALLNPGQLDGSEPLDEPLPVGAALEGALGAKIRALPDDAQKALLVAAASGSPRMEAIAPAVSALGLDPALFEQAEYAGLVTVADGELTFSHPLIRSAAYHAAPPPDRRRAHKALAETLTAEEFADRRAWHLAAAAFGPDEDVAAALEDAAAKVRGRGGCAASATALERAARLTPHAQPRIRRLVQAGADAALAGRFAKALELFDEALALDPPAEIVAEVNRQKARLQVWAGDPMGAHALFVREAEKVEESDPSAASLILIEAALAAIVAAEIEQQLDTAQRACELAHGRGGPAEIYSQAMLGIARILHGDIAEGAPLLEPLVALESDRPDPILLWTGVALMWIEDYERARAVHERIIATARRLSAPSMLPFPLAWRSGVDFRTGRWASARSSAAECVRLGRELGQTSPFGLVTLARVDAAQGHAQEARDGAAEALEIARRHRVGSLEVIARGTLGFCDLGLGRYEDVVAGLAPVAAYADQSSLANPIVVQWRPDLIEAYIRLDRRDDARSALARLEQEAEHSQLTWARAAAARCRGLLAEEGSYEEEFQAALDLHDATPTPFERARTELCFGERLRRSGQRVEARTWLRKAQDTFEDLGAEPWAEHARTELRASGETARRRDAAVSDQLTAQELQVAMIVAGGATNREAAAALFLSPKTIEFHLGHIYRKLGLRSRAQLAAIFAGAGEGGVPALAER